MCTNRQWHNMTIFGTLKKICIQYLYRIVNGVFISHSQWSAGLVEVSPSMNWRDTCSMSTCNKGQRSASFRPIHETLCGPWDLRCNSPCWRKTSRRRLPTDASWPGKITVSVSQCNLLIYRHADIRTLCPCPVAEWLVRRAECHMLP